MKPFFTELFTYGRHFNRELAKTIAANPDQVSDRSKKLFSHILNAHGIWNSRIRAEQPPSGVWELRPLSDWETIDKLNYETSLALLDKYDLEQVIHYTNTKGIAYSGSVRDILFHIVNHSTYHRGQIAMDFRQNQIEPLVSDYSYYKLRH